MSVCLSLPHLHEHYILNRGDDSRSGFHKAWFRTRRQRGPLRLSGAPLTRLAAWCRGAATPSSRFKGKAASNLSSSGMLRTRPILFAWHELFGINEHFGERGMARRCWLRLS